MTARPHAALHFETVLLPGGWASDARVVLAEGVITSVSPDSPPQPGDTRLGTALPGMPNLHSHAFQRGMAGLAEMRGAADDSFWTWREIMYRFVDRITPDDLRAIAALAYMEMLESGFTRVGEFHYLHHDPDGGAYADPAETSLAIVAAAEETGIALTHLPVFYAHAGFGGLPPASSQRRFIHDIDGFAALLDRLGAALGAVPDAVLGAAPHSLRAVTPDQLQVVADLSRGPIHIHISEQIREVEDCLAWSGQRPVEWLLSHLPVDDRWCLVHATHTTEAELAAMAGTGAIAGLCPITEANLGDGIFPLATFRAAGGAYGIGSDSNVLVDAPEELRLLEYGQRLSSGARNVACAAGGSTGGTLYAEAVAGGARALGAPAGLICGAPADFLTIDRGHPSLAGRRGAQVLDGLIFAAGRSAIDEVWRRGRRVVAQGRHAQRAQIVARYVAVLDRLLG